MNQAPEDPGMRGSRRPSGDSVTDVEQRWRLVLGKYSNRRLSDLSGDAAAIDNALGFLYDRLYSQRGLDSPSPGERSAGLEASAPHVVDWLDQVNSLFPETVAQALATEAVERFGLNEILTDPRALDRIEPNLDTLRVLLSLRSAVPGSALSAVRRIVAAVVEELLERLRQEIQPILSGRVDRQRRTRRPTGALDPQRTIEANLGNWDPDRQRLLIDHVVFHQRARLRYPWDIILCVDQSGSMVGSVIHSAVLAGILASLPAVTVKLVVFDTSVVDLSHLTDDPVETLMSVQLGGGTDIAQAVQYCEQLVSNPTRTIVALITDFYEGGSVPHLLAGINRLAEHGVTLMGLAALDDDAGPSYDRNTAERVVAAGMPVAAMTPKEFAQWAAQIMQ